MARSRPADGPRLACRYERKGTLILAFTRLTSESADFDDLTRYLHGCRFARLDARKRSLPFQLGGLG